MSSEARRAETERHDPRTAVNELRKLAASFREVPTPPLGQPEMHFWVEIDLYRLQTKAGNTMMEERRNGWLPSLYELDEVAAANLHPRDLFVAAVGPELMPVAGETVNRVDYAAISQQAGSVSQMFARAGVLPLCGLQAIERYARACEGLADLIESELAARQSSQRVDLPEYPPSQESESPTLLTAEVNVLQALAESRHVALHQVTIKAKAGHSVGVTRDALARLRDLGFVSKAGGRQRKGDVITPSGLAHLKELSASQPE